MDGPSTLISSASSMESPATKSQKQRRRRFVQDLWRMTSSPQLHKGRNADEVRDIIPLVRSISCGELEPVTTFAETLGIRTLRYSFSSTEEGAFITEESIVQQSTPPSVDHLSELPVEIKILIFGFLSPRELVKISSVSKVNMQLLRDVY